MSNSAAVTKPILGFSLRFQTPGLNQQPFVSSWRLTNTRGRNRVPESEMWFYVSSFSQSIRSSSFMTSLYQQANFTGNTLQALRAKRCPCEEQRGRRLNGSFYIRGQRKMIGEKIRDGGNRNGKEKKIGIGSVGSHVGTVLWSFAIQSCKVVHMTELLKFFTLQRCWSAGKVLL